MSNYAKAATLILTFTVPVLAMAQSAQVKPSPQVRPAASTPSGSTATPAPATQPSAAPNSPRFVTSENSFTARPKPQPTSSAPVGTQPVAPRPMAATNNVPQPGMPQAFQPAAVPAALVQSAAVTGSPASATGHDAAVEYASGKLTVVSNSAPLGFVLKLVAAKTGAVVDLAPELQNEPVVARLGPGSVREVLTGLLDSPRVDYIVLGTGDEPGSLQRIVVRTRRSFGQVAMAAMQPRQPKQVQAEGEENLDQNGHLGAASAELQLTQEQLMENWKKIRAEKLQAEIKQQAQDRENERNQTPDPPMPPDNPPAENPPQDNPPQQ